MSDDESRRASSRPVEKKPLPAGPMKTLRDALFQLYAQADRPPLATFAEQIADEDDLPGLPGKDLIGKIISGDRLASQRDTVTVAVALARLAGRQDVARIADQVRQSWNAAVTAEPPPLAQWLGRPFGECDPLVLEVHQAIQVPDAGTGTSAGPLPGYVPRAHDTLLREAADRLLGGGSSRLVTLVGGSSTGKTRACWELARYLDQQQPGRWRVWHPYDPTLPQAAVSDLERVGAHTVVWLNEAQHYLMPTDSGLGERLTAGLRTLLHDPGRAPVIVLATLWPQYWDTLTVRPDAGQPDPYAQARELLTGTMVPVADMFTAEQVTGLAAPGVDARLRYAAEHTDDGRITQYVAGAPELETRYRTVGPAARALIQVAMDARRLGHPLPIARTLLERAAPGYLDDHDWDSLGEDWLEQALADTARPCKGTRGPLTRIRSRPGQPTPEGGPSYRLADYLEQTGRTERAGVYPPDSLWQAFATITDPDLLRSLGWQAEGRGRYQHAIWLFRRAADYGSTEALLELARLQEQSGDKDNAEALYRQAAELGDTTALWELAERLQLAGDAPGAATCYQQAADYGNTRALWKLAEMREQASDLVGAEAFYQQAADRGDAEALTEVARLRTRAGDPDGARAVAMQAASRGNTERLKVLAEGLRFAGDLPGSEALYRQAADCGDSGALRTLAEMREQAGDPEGADALYREDADRGNTWALARLAGGRERAGDPEGAADLYQQAVERGDVTAWRALVRLREQVNDPEGAADLCRKAADHGTTGPLMMLADLRKLDGNRKGADILYQEAADRGDAQALEILAVGRERAGDPEGAADRYQQAVERGNIRALLHLVGLWERAGNWEGIDALVAQAKDRGDDSALRVLAGCWERAGRRDAAESLLVEAANYGDTEALPTLAEMRERAGDQTAADQVWKFGLTGSGGIATGLDFESPSPPPA